MSVTDTSLADWSTAAASNAPVGGATPEIDDELRNIKAVCKTNIVALTGNQTIAGTKTFSTIPVISDTATITADSQATHKAYVDSAQTAAQDHADTAIAALNIPSGLVMAWPTETAPTGWLECNGAAVSRTTYSALFAIIGEIYGNGDGSTTFNLPDYRGRFLRGWDHAAGVDPNAATRTDRGDGTTGDHVGTLQADAFEAHTHTYNMAGSTQTAQSGSGTNNLFYNQTGFNTGSSGGSETRPVNINVMYIIKI